MWYSVASDTTRERINPSGDNDPATTIRLPLLARRFLDRAVSPAGILVSVDRRGGSPEAYDLGDGTPNFTEHRGAVPGPRDPSDPNYNQFGNGKNNPGGQHWTFVQGLHFTYSFYMCLTLNRIFNETMASADFIDKHLRFVDHWSAASERFVRADQLPTAAPNSVGAWMEPKAVTCSRGTDGRFNTVMTVAEAR
jgi:hypothetical protein